MKKKELDEKVSIRISPTESLKMELFVLDFYSMKMHNTLYEVSKEEVLKEIKALSKINNTHSVKELRFLMLVSLLTKEKQPTLRDKYLHPVFNHNEKTPHHAVYGKTREGMSEAGMLSSINNKNTNSKGE